jgi:hypothetical protein
MDGDILYRERDHNIYHIYHIISPSVMIRIY